MWDITQPIAVGLTEVDTTLVIGCGTVGIGVIFGSRNALRVFPSVIKMMEKRQQPFMDLITKIYPFDETPQAFQDWDTAPGNYHKILIDLRA